MGSVSEKMRHFLALSVMLANNSAATPSTAKIGLDKNRHLWYNTPMPNEPPDDLVCRTYPYAYGYTIGRISVLLDNAEQIALDSQTISKPAELRNNIDKIHSLIRSTHLTLTSIKVQN